jgi:hypothetical protein
MKRSRDFSWWLLLFLLALTGARFALGLAGPVTSAEAYYWLLGERWEWASFEGPGGLPGLVAILGSMSGTDAAVLRALSPLWLLLGSLGLWWWGRQVAGERAAFWLVVAWNVLPAVNAMALEFGPDSLLVAFWLWFGALAWKAAHDEREAALWWAAAGVVAAGGALVSYFMLMAPVGVAVFWLADRSWWARLLLRRSRSPRAARSLPRLHPLSSLVLLLPLLALAGPILWNAQTNWVAFAGQTRQSLTAFGGENIYGALSITAWEGGLLFPVLAVLLFCALTLVMVSSREARWWWAQSLLPLAWLFLRLWRGESGTLPLLLLLPGIMVWAGQMLFPAQDSAAVPVRRLERHLQRWLRWVVPPAILISAFVAAVSVVFFRPSGTEPDWAALAARLQRVTSILQVAGERPFFLVAGEGDAAAGLGFHFLGPDGTITGDFPPVYLRESQNLANQFGLWPRYDEFVDAPDVIMDEFFQEQRGYNPNIGRGALYLGAEPPDKLPQVISNGFIRLIPIERIQDPRGRVFYLYQCEDYQTAPL